MEDTSDDIRFKLPRPRKIILTIICSTTFVNVVLLCVTLVRPVPQFSSSATLLTIEAADRSTFAKRWVFENDAPPASTAVAAENTTDATISWLSEFQASAHNKRSSHEEDEEDQDENCWPCESSESKDEYSDASSEHATPPPHAAVTTYRTRTRHAVQTVGDVVTKTASAEAARKTTATSEIDLNAFVAMWIGPLGIAMQRASGDLVASAASFSPKFGHTYEQSGLRPEVVSKLPSGTGGSSVGLLLAILMYSACQILYAFTLTPASWIWTPYGIRRSLDTRHQLTFTFTTLLSVIALITVVVPTVMLRNDFSKVVKALPALDGNLSARLGDNFKQLYAVCVLAALVLLESILLVIEDLHFPWWYHGSVQTQLNAWQGVAPALNFTAGPAYVDQETGQYASNAPQTPANLAGAFQYTPRML